jgi:alkanesulfonate monooxygenase SsuD/methylene tetrahydromethanopterin reductase-like flavin-dependent oxidoreductase (luciferase family)
MMAARVIVRDTQDEADQVRHWIADNVDLPAARNFVAALMGGIESIREAFGDKDEAELLRMWGGAVGEHEAYCCGPPEKIARSIIDLHREVGCQGLLLTFPLWHEDEIRRFGKQVMPLLAEAGVWTHPSRRGWNW